jgi:small subunit ribosomal protein S16
MSLVMRLQRYGSKNSPFFHVVVADKRFARNGRFIEKLGFYDPKAEPSIIELKSDRMAHWYKLGARPSDTVNTLLKAKKVDLSKV